MIQAGPIIRYWISSKKDGFLPSTLWPQNWPIQATTNRTRETQKTLAPLHADESPFSAALPKADARGVTFVRPELVGEVRYSERTSDGRLRQPSWRGLRTDKEPADVVWE